MDASITPYIVSILAAIGVVSLILYFVLNRKETSHSTVQSLYSDGLRHLLEGNLKTAVDELKEVVRRDTGHIDAYVKLGDIFRKNGQFEQALKIHQSLTVRKNLSLGQQLDIYHSIVRDLRELGQYQQALKYADKMLGLDRTNLKAMRAKLDVYRLTDRWEDAAEILTQIQKSTGKENSTELALYKVQEGKRVENKGAAKDARILYRKALKIDPDCCPAFLYLGDSYDEEGRTEEAIENWETFGKKCPDLLYLVSEQLEQRLFELGNFSEIERFYRQILEKYPDSIEASVGIASFYDKKGETEAAIRSLEDVVDKAPDSLRARAQLTRLYNKQRDTKNVEQQLEVLLANQAKQFNYRCSTCGYTAKEPQWLCPECLQVNTFFDENT